MRTFQILTFALTTVAAGSTFAAEFSLTAPVLVLEQGLLRLVNWLGNKVCQVQLIQSQRLMASKKTVTVNEDMLFRTGLADGLELQLGWQGPAWTQTKRAGKT